MRKELNTKMTLLNVLEIYHPLFIHTLENNPSREEFWAVGAKSVIAD